MISLKFKLLVGLFALGTYCAFGQTTNHPGNVALGDGTGDGELTTKFADGQHFRFHYPRWVGGYEWSTSSRGGRVDLMRLTGYNGSNKLYVNGKVGIGIASPTASLHVIGNALINGDFELEGTGSGTLTTDFADGQLFKFYYPRWQGGWEWSTSGASGEVKVMKLSNINGHNRLFLNGQFGIGTENMADFKLSVAGKIRADEIKVYTGWADFVFQDDYVLRPLAEVKAFIQQHKHLPEVPSEAEVLENGVDVGAMNAKLLQKIEELTLYMIEQNEKILILEEKVNQLQK